LEKQNAPTAAEILRSRFKMGMGASALGINLIQLTDTSQQSSTPGNALTIPATILTLGSCALLAQVP